MLHAKLLTVAGVMYDNWGQFQRSVDNFEQCRAICERVLDPNDEFLAGIYNDLGNTSESMNEPKTAIDWHRKAWEIRKNNVDPTEETVAHSKSNIARSLLMLDQDQDAGKMMDEACAVFQRASAWFHESQYVAHSVSLGSNVLLTWPDSCHYCKGNLLRKENKFAEAKVEYETALRLLIEKVNASSHVRTCACYYKLGAIAIEENEIDLAL